MSRNAFLIKDYRQITDRRRNRTHALTQVVAVANLMAHKLAEHADDIEQGQKPTFTAQDRELLATWEAALANLRAELGLHS